MIAKITLILEESLNNELDVSTQVDLDHALVSPHTCQTHTKQGPSTEKLAFLASALSFAGCA